MPRSFLLADLRLRCQQRADKEGDAQIQPDEWNRLISEMYGEIYSIAEGAGLRHFETEATIIATGATSYALPADHLATIDVARVLDVAGHRGRLRRIMVQERDRWFGSVGDARRYELAGANMLFYPNPTSGTYKHLYMPQAPDLSLAADSTPIDLVCADGEAFIVWGVVCKALPKSESDVQVAMAERDAARERFGNWCAVRAFNDGPRVFVDRYVDDLDYYNPSSFRSNPP